MIIEKKLFVLFVMIKIRKISYGLFKKIFKETRLKKRL